MKFWPLLIFSTFAWAAPYPMTGSSFFLNGKTNLFLWPFHIELNLQKTPYSIDLSQTDTEKWTVLVPRKNMEAYIRIRNLKTHEDYDKSLKLWIREYEKSGYQIVSQQIPGKNPEHGMIHLQDSSEKQLVQSFRYQNKIWVYFNCLGKKADIADLKKTCDDLSQLLKFRD